MNRRWSSSRAALVLATLLMHGCGGTRNDASRVVRSLINIDSTHHFQTITGWEVSAQAGQEDVAAYHSYRDSLLSLAAHDLGITRVRLSVRSGFENSADIWAQRRAGIAGEFRCARYTTVNDNDDPLSINKDGFHFSQLDYTIEEFVLPLKKRVEARGEKLYVNAEYVAFMKQCPARARYDHTSPAEYAEFVLATYQHLRDKYQLVPDAWEVILEPDNTAFWRGRQIGEAIVASARLLEKNGFRPRFIAPSTTKAANAPLYFDEMMAVPGVLPYLEELSYHRYGGFSPTDFTAIAERAARYHVNTSMLEHIGSGYRNLHEDLKTAGVSAWQQFALAYPAQGDDGAQYYLVRNADSAMPALELGKRTRFLRQYLRYIRPGAVRIGASSNEATVDALAFAGPRGGYVVVIKCESAARVTIAGLPKGDYGARYTTAGETDQPATVDVVGKNLEVAIPARGVITIYDQRNFSSRGIE